MWSWSARGVFLARGRPGILAKRKLKSAGAGCVRRGPTRGASSGGETRIIRMSYAADENLHALVAAIPWRNGKNFSGPRAARPLFSSKTGVLWLEGRGWT